MGLRNGDYVRVRLIDKYNHSGVHVWEGTIQESRLDIPPDIRRKIADQRGLNLIRGRLVHCHGGLYPVSASKVRVPEMKNPIVVNGVLDLMEDADMREKWESVGGNVFKYADIIIGPTAMRFQGTEMYLSFFQRLKFLRYYSALQEYHQVKAFRDSLVVAKSAT